MIVLSMTDEDVIKELNKDRDYINNHHPNHQLFITTTGNNWHRVDLFAEGAMYFTNITTDKIRYAVLPYSQADKEKYDYIIFTECALKEYRSCHAFGQGSLALALRDYLRTNHHFSKNIQQHILGAAKVRKYIAHLASGTSRVHLENRLLIVENYKMYD